MDYKRAQKNEILFDSGTLSFHNSHVWWNLSDVVGHWLVQIYGGVLRNFNDAYLRGFGLLGIMAVLGTR